MGCSLSNEQKEFGDNVLLKVIESGGHYNIPRYRKAYIRKLDDCYRDNDYEDNDYEDNDESVGLDNYIVTVGRCGGGNRDEYEDEIDENTLNSLYVTIMMMKEIELMSILYSRF